ncbi:MAG TPA: hypothetical protein VGH28_13845 [Polyangiaceae bacterium]|jgi:phage tail sheath gpL-like
MSYAIPGFDDTWLLPFFGIQINLATGPNLAPGEMNVLLMGNRTSAGNLVADSEIRQVFSRTDINTAAGEGSELALMGLAALAAAPNVSLFLMAITEAGGGAAATVTITVTGSPTAAGTYALWINGKKISASYASGASVTTIAAAIVAAVSAQPDCPFTAANAAGVVTLTSRSKGIRQNDWILYQDTVNASGAAFAIAGSANVNSSGTVSGVRAGASAGTGTDSVTTALASANFLNTRWARIGVAQNDVTNAALVKAALAAQAAVTKQVYDQACYGFNGTQSNTATLSQTTLNDPRENVFTCRNCETHPALIAAGWAATRAAVEAVSYVPDYDGYDCSAWVAPQRFGSDVWLDSEANALLNAGASPITTVNGVAKLTRGVTTYCLNGSSQDTRCLDIGDAVVPDQFALALTNLYWTQFRAANPRVEANPDFANGEPFPAAGIGYPLLWDQTKKAMMADWASGAVGSTPWASSIKDTFSGTNPKYPVVSGFDDVAERITGATTIVPVRVAHTISEIINQAAA